MGELFLHMSTLVGAFVLNAMMDMYAKKQLHSSVC